jgi:4-hydroxybenzoate polyprenyltransferase
MIPPAATPTPRPRDVLIALRPRHWVKNLLVLAPLFFALGDPAQQARLQPLWVAVLRAVAAMSLFCAVASGIYVMNDIRDIELDRAHPAKRFRPIAAGRIGTTHAWFLVLLLVYVALLGALLLGADFRLAFVLEGYILLQLAYTYFLKRLGLVDVLVIAFGFVLRALAGAVALRVTISPWLLLCTFLLALFLGFCKRRHEKVILSATSQENRPSLDQYDEKLLDQLIGIVASATIISYALYTLSPETQLKFGGPRLGFSIPFVIFGIFRYLDLVYRHEKGDKPQRVLLTDLPILINLAVYGLTVLYLIRH